MVEVSKPDAAPPAPEPVQDAAVEATNTIADANADRASHTVVCGEPSLAHAKHVLRGKVREAGGSEVKKDQSTYAITWVIVDILEVLDGDGIAPTFKKSFYATTITEMSTQGGGHGWGGRGIATELANRKGDELVFIATLPDRGGSEGGTLPPKLLREYGPKSPTVYAFCPLDQRDAILAAKEQLRLRARPR